MTNSQLQLEDLILSSRSLTLEEKQELLKRLDSIAPEKKVEIKEILERERSSFKRIDEMALAAIRQFTQDLKLVTATIPIQA